MKPQTPPREKMSMHDAPKPSIKGPVTYGLLTIILFIGGFILWSFLAQLESAAIAQGQIIAETKNKTVEHLEGGIIKGIHVKDGQKVKQGQALIKLDVTKAKSQLDVLSKQYDLLLAEEARLIAERDNKKEISFPKDLGKDEKIKSIQRRLLKMNRQTFNGQLAIYKKQIEQLKKEIQSYKAQVKAENEQLKLINQEIKAVEYLEKRKLIELPRLLELRRNAADLTGNHGQYLGMIARSEQKIGETNQRIITLKDEYIKNILTELKEVRNKLADIKPKLESAQDTLHRTTITAPIKGIVVGLTQHTIGGVINPGESLMTIFPSQDRLIAEANVNPSDIELIRNGQTARIYLTALKQRNTPSLMGKVVHLSADVFHEQNTNERYYRVKIEIDDKELKKLDDVKLYPGMQVRVMIITDKRTPMDYFLTPIFDSFRYAFREN